MVIVTLKNFRVDEIIHFCVRYVYVHDIVLRQVTDSLSLHISICFLKKTISLSIQVSTYGLQLVIFTIASCSNNFLVLESVRFPWQWRYNLSSAEFQKETTSATLNTAFCFKFL